MDVPFRDIRADLKDRLADADERIRAAEKRLEELHAERGMYATMLSVEERRVLEQDRKQPSEPLPDFVERLVGVRPRTKEELRELAVQEGYLNDANSPGRAIHAVTVNLDRSGRIKAMEDGRYIRVTN